MNAERLRQRWRRFFSDPSTSRYLIYRLLAENFHLYARRYAIAFFFMAIVAVTTALSAWIMRDIVNEIFISKDFKQVLIISLFVMLIFVTKGFATYVQTTTLARIGTPTSPICKSSFIAISCGRVRTSSTTIHRAS